MNYNPVFVLFSHAKRQAKLSKYLGFFAIASFVVFGSLASLAAFKDNHWVYSLFLILPYVFVGISIPISLYHGFLLYRYRIMQPAILKMVFALCILFSASAIGLWFFYPKEAHMAAFLALVSWFCLPYLFYANIERFLSFLTQQQTITPKASLLNQSLPSK